MGFLTIKISEKLLVRDQTKKKPHHCLTIFYNIFKSFRSWSINVIAHSKESRLNFTAHDYSHIQKGRIQFFIGATRLDADGEIEFLIASKSILQTPVKHRKDSYITVTAGLA